MTWQAAALPAEERSSAAPSHRLQHFHRLDQQHQRHQSLKQAHNSLKLIDMTKGDCEASASCVGSYSSNVRPNASSSTRFSHRLHHKGVLTIVEARTLVGLPLAPIQRKVLFAICTIVGFTKLKEPVIARAHELLLLSGPVDNIYACLHV